MGPTWNRKLRRKCAEPSELTRATYKASFYENRLNRPFSHVADELVDGSALEQLTVIDDFSLLNPAG